MARGRMMSKSLSTSERFALVGQQGAELGEFCQVLYQLLVPHSDDFGRQQGDVFTVKMAVFPTSPREQQEFDRALQVLHDAQLIERYEVGGRKYIQILNFDEHQTGLHKRTRSQFPDHPSVSGKAPEFPSEQNRTKQNRSTDHRSALEQAFDTFWAEYPRKAAKDAARREWHRLAPDNDLAATIAAALRSHKASPQWIKDDGQFIPHARTWLHQRRWEDQPSPKPVMSVSPEVEDTRRKIAEMNARPVGQLPWKKAGA